MTNHVSVRLDVETMARVDALAPAFSTEWHAATRSDILRALILDSLERYERGGSDPQARPRGSVAKGKTPKPRSGKQAAR
jgi:hypothetical protein